MKSFSIQRKSGYHLGSFTSQKAVKNNTCGCGAVIKAGQKKVVFSGPAGYPVNLCRKCAKKLAKVLV